jgi:hypothetical protein
VYGQDNGPEDIVIASQISDNLEVALKELLSFAFKHVKKETSEQGK